MGVHLTFVRSVDLDEWTQRQVDCMTLGGNGNAREFFRKHGFTELYGAKAEKKYRSKAAVAYKAELQKVVDASAAKRGEEVDSAGTWVPGSLLENLEVQERKEQQEIAKQKLAEARAAASGGSIGTLAPSAKLASSMPGASKLAVPSSGLLRKPASSNSNNFMMKKPTTSISKLRVNKLSIAQISNGEKDDDFEDIETTQKNAAITKNLSIPTQSEPVVRASDESSENQTVQAIIPPKPAPQPSPIAQTISEPQKKPTFEDNVSKLKAMNKDFFSQF
jgi:ADP-ribosylation factor GTPase-activating protein 2/3